MKLIDPRRRDDISRFLVHLTRNDEYNSISALENLINILDKQQIEARNPHCLFKYDIKDFSSPLKEKFNTVCFTETPIHQIKKIAQDIPKRRIKLKPFGLVFWKDSLLKKGANPAIYINSEATELKEFLLKQFRTKFVDIHKYTTLQKEEFCDAIIQYYSLINVVNSKNDFMWEREWRYSGNLSFSYHEVVAIIAEDPDEFIEICSKKLNEYAFSFINRTPVISPEWDYEEFIERLSFEIWENRNLEIDFEPDEDYYLDELRGK